MKKLSIKSNLKEIELKLKRLEKYECNCRSHVYDHKAFCNIVLAGIIGKELLLEKMKLKIQ